MGRETGNLVSKSLCLDLADVIDDSLIYMEVVSQPTNRHAQLAQLYSLEGWIKTVRFGAFPLSAHNLLSVVLLDKRSGGSFNGLGSHSSLHNEAKMRLIQSLFWVPTRKMCYLPLLLSLLNTRFINNIAKTFAHFSMHNLLAYTPKSTCPALYLPLCLLLFHFQP